MSSPTRRDVRPRAIPERDGSSVRLLPTLSLTLSYSYSWTPRHFVGFRTLCSEPTAAGLASEICVRGEMLRMGYRLREYLVSLAAFYRSLASLSPRGTACLAIHLTKFHPLFCRQKRGGGVDDGRWVDRRVVRSTAITDSWGDFSGRK